MGEFIRGHNGARRNLILPVDGHEHRQREQVNDQGAVRADMPPEVHGCRAAIRSKPKHRSLAPLAFYADLVKSWLHR